ncbi:putative inactive disease susceptibility protein LOV1 [Macadamia integrifolia]|uniref:putative inactive disease susceptibility protein LOV1 n=1 Tax=Macadamia integrifolia TaxID=60698 RepID=UPI001C4F46CB|nr:putative inactive disease susceptibility protein LOV1 [Macadamia integrifolia]
MKTENSRKKIKRLSDDRSRLCLVNSEAGQISGRGDLVVHEFCVIGLEKEENEIVKKLLIPIEPPRPCPAVVSIVGIGGSGKTTFARKTYQRNDVKEHFQTLAWISVSQIYNVRDLLQISVEQIKPPSPKEKVELDSLDVESLIHRLSSHLKETTYLIVFDDLWRPEDWNMLKQALPDQGEGYQSRVLVTTRNETVARCADPSRDPYHLPLLNEYESWKLFLTKVMSSKDAGCPEDLEDLGRQIVQKCHGLPMATVVLGGLLSTKPRTHSAWSKILDSINWELNQNEGNCKQDYLEELIQRSIIQATVRSYDGRVTFCHIHDLVRDLAVSEGKQERFLEVLGRENLISPNKPRRLSIIEPTRGMYGSPTIALNQRNRSLLCYSRDIERNMWMKCLYGTMKLLRVLDLKGLHFNSMPSTSLKQIGKLMLLKYLSIRGTDIAELPSSIGELQYLQTLDLGHTSVRQQPVMTIMKLQQLRNLTL